MSETMPTYHPSQKARQRAGESLSDDIDRCHDGKCGVRYQCERWLQRNNSGTYVRHASTLKQGPYCHEGPCPSYIGPKWVEDE